MVVTFVSVGRMEKQPMTHEEVISPILREGFSTDFHKVPPTNRHYVDVQIGNKGFLQGSEVVQPLETITRQWFINGGNFDSPASLPSYLSGPWGERLASSGEPLNEAIIGVAAWPDFLNATALGMEVHPHAVYPVLTGLLAALLRPDWIDTSFGTQFPPTLEELIRDSDALNSLLIGPNMMPIARYGFNKKADLANYLAHFQNIEEQWGSHPVSVVVMAEVQYYGIYLTFKDGSKNCRNCAGYLFQVPRHTS